MNAPQAEILVIGAGACGLMAARELSQAGKKVIVLEARDRIGGRIWPLPEKDFGYPAQGGAEFVHGHAPVTKGLIKEAGLTYVSMPDDGEMWSMRNGMLVENDAGPAGGAELAASRKAVVEKLKILEKDIPIADFLEKYFGGEQYASLRDWITGMVKGYDAADPERMSAFSLRDEWLGGGEWEQGRVKEGYGALLNFLESECRKKGVVMYFGREVKSIVSNADGIVVGCVDGNSYRAKKVLVTVPLPVLSRIDFKPALPEKMAAVSDIGFGGAIKIILRFTDRLWIDALGKDLSKLTFMLADGKVTAWWTEYPEPLPVIVGWIPGPASEEFKSTSDKDLLDLALDSLSTTFKVRRDVLEKKLVASRVVNWLADPFAQGAYSYPTPETKEAVAELAKPADGKIFFAGEALYSGKDTTYVEGALGSGKETAKKILDTPSGAGE